MGCLVNVLLVEACLNYPISFLLKINIFIIFNDLFIHMNVQKVKMYWLNIKKILLNLTILQQSTQNPPHNTSNHHPIPCTHKPSLGGCSGGGGSSVEEGGGGLVPRLVAWLRSCSISSGFVSCICCANCCPLVKEGMNKLMNKGKNLLNATFRWYIRYTLDTIEDWIRINYTIP